jgi:hypothetical protein
MMRLGRLNHDPSRLAAIPAHTMAAGAPVPEVVTPPEGFRVELCRNDLYTTCTTASLINAARVWALKTGRFDLVYDVDKLLAFFCRVLGIPVSAIATAEGAVMMDVLENAQSGGFQINDQDTLVPMFRRITDADGLRQAIASTGAAYVGVDLDEQDMSQDWTARAMGKVEGGHAIALIGYRPGGFTAATWGVEKLCDEGWLMARLQEAYLVTWAL